MISAITQQAINKCLRLGIPFAAFAFPGKNDIHFIAGNVSDADENLTADIFHGMTGGYGFVINPFGMGHDNRIVISGCMSEHEIINMPDSVTKCDCPTTSDESTDYDSYKSQIERIVDWHKTNGGKTVLSRIVSIESCKSPADVIDSYFTEFPNCFRHAYFSSKTGFWIGATPELLLDYTISSNTAITMSLAGTRKVGASAADWDGKNTREHDIVTDYICEAFMRNGLDPEVSLGQQLPFGEIEHLCHVITAHGAVDVDRLLLELSPTPAVCGYPRVHALDTITYMEKHRRTCYGGYIGVIQPDKIQLFVNLRCASVTELPNSGFRYTLYGGGGITAESNSESEWIETAYKMSKLYRIITEDDDLASLFYPLNTNFKY